MEKKVPRRNFSSDDLKSASAHVFYEIWMMRSTSELLTNNPSKLEQVEVNALLESFIIHFRCLFNFFYLYNSNSRATDIFAVDYFDKPETYNALVTMPECLKAFKHRADREIAHLTDYRLSVTPENKPWPTEFIKDMLNNTIIIFLHNVDKKNLANELQEEKMALRHGICRSISQQNKLTASQQRHNIPSTHSSFGPIYTSE